MEKEANELLCRGQTCNLAELVKKHEAGYMWDLKKQ